MKFPVQHKVGFFSGIILFFIILIIPFGTGLGNIARYTAACAVLMAVWWLSEAIPLAATALLPLVLFPLLKILPAGDVAQSYADSNILLFLGGFFIAFGMQRHNLHKRIALNIIKILGTSPRKIVLGFMVATAFLSMWISNTATAMMMLPIGIAVIEHIKPFIKVNQISNKPNGRRDNIGIALMLGIAYSASIGGVGTLVGTPPNIIFAGVVKNMFPALPEIDFVRWLGIGMPIVLVFLPITWLYLVYIGAPVVKTNIPGGKEIIKSELSTLGKMKRGELLTLIVFCITALGWIFRRDIAIGNFQLTGWASWLGISKYINDSTVALIGALLLFIIPLNLKKNEFILNWEWAQRIPWGILILFGGGFALAKGFESSGLDQWIGSSFGAIGNISPLIIVVVVCLLLTFLTEITSNTATITMILPVLGALTVSLGLNPFILMVPATISTSCAFMMPVATPPNAIVFGSGYLKIQDMARIGFTLNLTGIIIITILMYFCAFPLLGIALS